ncbi:MAG: BLUF domain-containing protein [Microcystaceae cyanobacterium]
MNLCRLIYSSHASTDLTYHDLKEIMEKSEKNNKPDGITGLLCYGDSMFLQILEGDRRLVSQTYHRIALDQRHHTPVIIECSAIELRTFEVWSMRTVKLVDLDAQKIRNLLLKYSSSIAFQPDLMTGKQCLLFMQDLASFGLN